MNLSLDALRNIDLPRRSSRMAPGIDRAVEAGIPVACCTGDVTDLNVPLFLV